MGARLRVARWLEVCIPLLCIPGCSFWAVRGPNASVAGGGDCSTSVVAPVVDGVFAASFVGLGVAGVAAPRCDSQGTGTGFSGPCLLDFSGADHGAGAGLIALGVLEAVAATYGAAKVNACHEARKHLQASSSPGPTFPIGTDAGPDPARRAAVSAGTYRRIASNEAGQGGGGTGLASTIDSRWISTRPENP